MNKRHIITTSVEHSSVLETCKYFETRGYKVSYLSVNEAGQLDLHGLENAITDNTCLVSVMWANNETGVIYPIHEIAALCNKKSTLFHTDAVLSLDVTAAVYPHLDIGEQARSKLDFVNDGALSQSVEKEQRVAMRLFAVKRIVQSHVSVVG